MKRLISTLSLLILFTAAATAQETKSSAFSYRDPGSPLPTIRLVDGKLNEYTNDSVKSNHNFFLIMFNPTCGHCLTMGTLIADHEELFQDNQVFFMAPATMMSYIGAYLEQTGLYTHPKFVVGVDSAQAVDYLFNFNTLPQINVYDKDHRLIKTFNGDTPLDSLKRYAR